MTATDPDLLLVEVTRLRELLAEAQAQHRRAREEAARQTALLRAMSASLFRGAERERRELAAVLHDVLGQQLVAARLQMVAGGAAGLDRAAVQQVCAILDQAHQSLHQVTFRLRPPILDDLGLVAALRWLGRELQAVHGVPIVVAGEEVLPRSIDDSEYLLYRCVRELLDNAVAHASARSIRVEVADTDEMLVLRVIDDGQGFDPERVAAERMTRRGFGLLGVQERIVALGGGVRIDSAPGRGTRIELRVPIAE